MKIRALAMSCVLALAPLSAPMALAQSGDRDVFLAQEYADEAFTAFEAKDFDRALELYLQSFDRDRTPEVTYNIAFIYFYHRGDVDRAEVFYRRVLTLPDSPSTLILKSTDALKQIETQRQLSAAEQAAAAAERAAQAQAMSRGVDGANWGGPGSGADEGVNGTRIAQYSLIGTGAAIGVAGIAVGMLAQQDAKDAKDAETLGAMREGHRDAKNKAAISDAMTFGGLAIAVGSLVWFFLDDGRSPEVAPGTTVYVTPTLGGGAYVGVNQSF